MSPWRNKRLLILALAHFFTDFFSGAAQTIVLTAQTVPLGLSQGQVGGLAFLYTLATSVTQPLFGWLADRVRGPLLALVGFLWMLVFFAFSGVATNYYIFAILLIFAGLGVSAFHPPGAAGASIVSDVRNRGGSMSLFLTGGGFGHALGPLVAGLILERLGPRGTLVMGGLGVLIVPFLALTLSRVRYDDIPTAHATRGSTSKAATHTLSMAGVGALMGVIFLRSWAIRSQKTFLPQLFTTMQGLPLDFSGNVLFVWGLFAALGSLVSGFIADRLGRRVVIASTLLLAVPLMMFQLHLTGLGLMISTALIGFCLQASNPLTVSLGQELMPDQPGVMSGLTMGFTFVMGGIGIALTGLFADYAGLEVALAWLPVLALVGGVLALFLPGVKRPALTHQPASEV